jgi:tetratricopeptide (TPR) repeat protein
VLGNIAHTAGDYATAERHYRTVLAAERRTYAGHPSPEEAGAMENLASALHNQHQLDESRTLYTTSIAMFEATVGPEHPDVALPLTGLGTLDLEAGNYDQAAKYFERVIAIRTKALGAEHPYVSEPLAFLARVEHDRHHDARAIELYRRAMTIAEHSLGPNHPLTAVSQGHLAELLEHRGDHAAARSLLEAAVATWEVTGASLPDADDARFLLAQLAWKDGAHARARKLAETARVHYAALPEPWDATAKEIATWLGAHR